MLRARTSLTVGQNTYRNLCINLTIAASVSVFTLVVLDVLVVSLFPQQLPDRTEHYSPDPYLGWTYAKGKRMRGENVLGGQVDLEFTKEGFRDWQEEVPLDSEVGILYVGDSVTGAIQVNRKEHFIQLIDDELQRQGMKSRGYNYGVNGYSTDQVLMVVAQFIQRLRPRVVVYVFVSNDLSTINVDRFQIGDTIYGKPLVKFNSNGSWDAVPPPFAKIERSTVRSKIRSMMDRSFILSRMLVLGRTIRRSITPSDAGDFRLANPKVDWTQMILERKQGGYSSVTWQRFEAMLVAMDRICRERGVQFLVFPSFDPWVTLASARQVISDGGGDPEVLHRQVLNIAQKNGIQVTSDVLVFVRDLKSLGITPDRLYFIRNNVVFDGHLSPYGHQVTAQYLGRWIERLVKKS